MMRVKIETMRLLCAHSELGRIDSQTFSTDAFAHLLLRLSQYSDNSLSLMTVEYRF